MRVSVPTKQTIYAWIDYEPILARSRSRSISAQRLELVTMPTWLAVEKHLI